MSIGESTPLREGEPDDAVSLRFSLVADGEDEATTLERLELRHDDETTGKVSARGCSATSETAGRAAGRLCFGGRFTRVTKHVCATVHQPPGPGFVAACVAAR